MTAADDRLRLGEERRLIFQNVANSVPMESIKAAFLRSEEEIWREVEFVGRKLREYRFRRHLPPLATQGIHAIRMNRQALLETLNKLGPEYLVSQLILPKIHVQDLTTPGDIKEASARSGLNVVGES